MVTALRSGCAALAARVQARSAQRILPDQPVGSPDCFTGVKGAPLLIKSLGSQPAAFAPLPDRAGLAVYQLG